MPKTSKTPATTTKQIDTSTDRARAVGRFETARHRAASKTADALLGKLLTFSQVVQEEAYAAFVERVTREEATLLSGEQIHDSGTAFQAFERILAALPSELQGLFNEYDEWKSFQVTTEAEAAFVIGLELGRR